VSKAITGLTAGTKYYFKIVSGATSGSILNFPTPSTASVTTNWVWPTVASSSWSVTFSATGTPSGSSNRANVCYATSYSSATTFNGQPILDGCKTGYRSGSYSSSTTKSINLYNTNSNNATPVILTANTVYYYQAFQTDSNGVVNAYGAILQMKTIALKPTTNAASSVGDTTGTLNGNSNIASTLSYCYSTTQVMADGHLASCPATPNPTYSVSSSPYSAARALTGLVTSTPYYFQVVASNATGTTYGAILNFSTTGAAAVAPAPITTTQAASSIQGTTAKLNGTINANGTATNGVFCYGTSASATAGVLGTCATSTTPIDQGSLSANSFSSFHFFSKSSSLKVAVSLSLSTKYKSLKSFVRLNANIKKKTQ
jgi:hypothetical protein